MFAGNVDVVNEPQLAPVEDDVVDQLAGEGRGTWDVPYIQGLVGAFMCIKRADAQQKINVDGSTPLSARAQPR